MSQDDQSIKADAGKPRLDLITPESQFALGRVLAYGAKKYSENSWQQVELKRYEAAILRHFYIWKLGESIDPESGLHHLDHVLCNAMFIQYLGTKEIDAKINSSPEIAIF